MIKNIENRIQNRGRVRLYREPRLSSEIIASLRIKHINLL